MNADRADRLPRLEAGKLFLSREQLDALGGGSCGMPAWSALKRLGMKDDELWSVAFKDTKLVVVDPDAGAAHGPAEAAPAFPPAPSGAALAAPGGAGRGAWDPIPDRVLP